MEFQLFDCPHLSDSMKSLSRKYLVLVFLAGIFGCTSSPRSSVDGYVPEEANLAVKTSPLGTYPEGLGDAMKRFPGGGGLFEMLEGLLGIDFTSEESLLKLGLETEQGLHFFLYDGLPFVLVALRDQDDGADWLTQQAKVTMGTVGTYKGAVGGDFEDFRFFHGEAVTKSRCGIRDRLLLCTHGPRPEELGEALAVIFARNDQSASFWSAGSNRKLSQPKERTVQGIMVSVGSASPSYRMMVDQASSAVLGGLGPVRFMLSAIPAFMKGLSESSLEFEIGGDEIDVHWKQPLTKPQRQTLGELFQTETGQDYTQWLPRDAPLALSLRLNLETLLSGMDGLLALIPEGALDKMHPVLKGVHLKEQMLNHFTGDVVVSLLGFEENIDIATMGKKGAVRRVLEGLDVAIELELRDKNAFLKAWDGHSLKTKRYEWLDIPAMGEGEEPGGRIRPKGGTGLNLAVSPQRDSVILLSGRSTYPMVKDVLEGTATSLNRRIDSDAARKTFSEGTSVASFYSSFWGLTRTMEERGLPRTTLALLNAFYEAWGAVVLSDDAFEMHMEVLF